MNSALIVVAAELLAQGSIPAVARNKTGTTDFAWVQSVSMTDKIYFKRGDTPCCSNVSPTDLGAGVSPECDVDDDTSITGQNNSVVVWNANSNEIWASINAGTAFRIGQKADNSYETGGLPRVGISRTAGRFVVTWDTGSAIRAQLYQIGSGSSVTRLSYPFYITDPTIASGSIRGFSVSCADDGDFVACYHRNPASGGPPPYYGTPPNNRGLIIKGWVMPTTFTGTPTALNFDEVKICGEGHYLGADCAVYADGSCVVAWNAGAPAAQRHSAAGALVSNTYVAITGGCNYPHPCGTTDGMNFTQEIYNVSVAAQRCAPGNYVVGYHAKRGSDSWETLRLKICEDEVRTHCSEDVHVMAASDLYPYPDVYKTARVGLDDCGRMVSVFWGAPYGSGWSLYTYLEALCDSCETECVSELEPCLEIPLPDCANDPLLSAAKRAVAKPAAVVAAAFAPVPVEPKGTKPAVAPRTQLAAPTRVVKLEPKAVKAKAATSKKPKSATN
jgi:hypothetical protein